MITVSLTGAEFFAFHGFYPEEQQLGNKFIVDIEVDFSPSHSLRDDRINQTVDYEQLYIITAEKMKQTRKLIETVAQAIADGIKEKFPFAHRINVSIKKINPPLGGKVDFSKIEITV